MASLRDAVKDYQDDLRNGIAWIAFWREGRAWNANYFYLEMDDDTIRPEDLLWLKEIRDTAAVALNGYYCGHLTEDMNLDELTAGVRYNYEQGHNQLADFIEAYHISPTSYRKPQKWKPTKTMYGKKSRRKPPQRE